MDPEEMLILVKNGVTEIPHMTQPTNQRRDRTPDRKREDPRTKKLRKIASKSRKQNRRK